MPQYEEKPHITGLSKHSEPTQSDLQLKFPKGFIWW